MTVMPASNVWQLSPGMFVSDGTGTLHIVVNHDGGDLVQVASESWQQDGLAFHVGVIHRQILLPASRCRIRELAEIYGRQGMRQFIWFALDAVVSGR